ncbi:hypothetical protein [Luteibacter sp. CQ10]|uniref:hypothetical protein n=1 Tax=Luteibacter sp. CQ10 TaxID=2805821 RepID=UPI0034A3F10E
MTIQASGLETTGGPKSQTFTIGDVGDANIRNSRGARFDIYRFKSSGAANAFGRKSAETVISNLPDDFECPDGFEEKR